MTRNTLYQIIFFIALVSAALAAGALLAYPMHLLLPDVAFSRLAERGSLICGLLASLLYVRWTMPLTWHAVGYRRPARGVWPVMGGAYAIGMLIMLLPIILLVVTGFSRIDPNETFTLQFFIIALLKGLAAGIGASLIEETLFRGALFSGLERRINLLWAMLLSSLLYAAVHFIEYPEPAAAIHWYTGLALFPAAMSKLLDVTIVSHFLTLFLLGIFLCQLRWRDGHIWRAFGVHAGIVMIIKLHSDFTYRTRDGDFEFLVNTYSSRLGWLTTIWLLLLVLGYYRYCRKHPRT